MRVVVGLGNPGPRYQDTRHNIGFLVADALAGAAASAGGGWVEAHDALVTTVRTAGQVVRLVKPQTYMNRSGAAVGALQGEWSFDPEEVLVVTDDFLLDFGRVRLRRGGSDGGHNGLASVLERLATQAVPRLRLGVGPVPAGETDIDFVLAPFADSDDARGLVERGCAATRCWLHEGIEAAMNRFNGSPPLT